MLGQSIEIEDVISTTKKMAVERGLNEKDLDRFLEKYAFRFGCNSLLKNLVGADFRLKQATNTLEYVFSKHLALENLSEMFESGEKILSIGCNVGLLETNLARKGCQVWGLDTNDKLIGVANRLAEEKGLSDTCKFVAVDGYQYPFDDGSFDRVLYSHSIHEIEDKGATLQESFRVLRSKGRVVILEDETTREDVTKAVAESRFAIVEERTALPGKIFNHGLVVAVIAMELEKG